MPAIRPRWLEPPPLPADLPPLHPDPLLHALIYRRGLEDREIIAAFLDPAPQPAPDPARLPGLTAAAERVYQALLHDEPIAIFGDYDADGITATALLCRAFAHADPPVVARLPIRAEGYGLNPAAIDEIAAAGARLLIAVDCASSDHVNVAYARDRGLDVVILDHHQMDGPGPGGALTASARLDPNGLYHELSAVGVAYLLAVTLARRGAISTASGGDPTELLDLVALGTIADVAPLSGANRALVRDGLRVLRTKPVIGLRALAHRAGVNLSTLTSEQVAFKITPRLNAPGRMDTPRLALDLLLTDDADEAVRLAAEVERLNVLRRAEAQRIVAEAERVLQSRPDLASRRMLVVAGTGWGSGVLGLAASRLVERFNRPVIVLNDDGTVSRGSARSVPGFDITQALAQCANLLDAHGGHSQAAGLTVATAQLSRLESRLEEAATAALAVPAPPALQLDAELPANRLTLHTAELLEQMQPFGAGNTTPLLRVRDVTVRSYDTIGQDKSHLKLALTTPNGVVQAVMWGAASRSRELLPRPPLDLALTIGLDHWNGQRRLQVEIKDFRPANGD